MESMVQFCFHSHRYIHSYSFTPKEVIQVSLDEVSSLLSQLDTSKATGPDKLPAIILKNCANSLSPSLAAFINTSLKTGLYLSEWKEANISPIHKTGQRADVLNYRPISLALTNCIQDPGKMCRS